MVKIKESNKAPIHPDRYYVWTWRPDTANAYVTQKSLYRKYLTSIPYFSRNHAKMVLVYMYGVDVLSYIHIIRGRKLIKQGIHTAFDVNWGSRTGKYFKWFWFKGRLVKARKFIIPDEYRLDKHRRRHFMVSMYNAFKNYGRKYFDEKYALKLYGQRPGIDYKYIHKRRVQIHRIILQEVYKINSLREIQV